MRNTARSLDGNRQRRCLGTLSTIAITALLGGCTSFTVTPGQSTSRVLVEEQVTGLVAKRYRGATPAQIRVRLARSGTRSYAATTTYSSQVDFTHNSLGCR
jgi:hypothetical protein